MTVMFFSFWFGLVSFKVCISFGVFAPGMLVLYGSCKKGADDFQLFIAH